MAVTYAGKVEAAYTVPTGGSATSVSTGALSAPVTATLPAATYYHTAAGGVSSGITALQTAINAAVTPYPQTAAAMTAAVGYGTWSAGWSFQIASGNDTGMFGGVTMTAVSTPTYSNTGPGTGGDLAIGFNSAADAFTAGDNFDPLGDDLCIAVVFKLTSATNGDISGKGWATSGHLLAAEAGGVTLAFYVTDGVDTITPTATGLPQNEWVVAMAVLDRTAGTARCGWRGLTTGTTTVSTATSAAAIGSLNAAGDHSIGASGGYGGHAGMQIAAYYVGAGAAAASGMSANLSTALTNFANAINSSFTVAVSTTDGRTTISNSFYPSSVTFTDTDLRDLLGFEYDFDYPATAAQMATALGYGTWTSGAGYLCNESSGNLAAVFGTPATLTAASTPTYSNLGPRGGNDKAVGFNSAADSFTGSTTDNDVGVSDDLFIVWAGKLESDLGVGQINIISQKLGATGYRLYMYRNGASDAGFALRLNDGVDSVFPLTTDSGANLSVGKWHVGVAVLDRGAVAGRVAVQDLTTGTATVGNSTSTAAIGSLSNANAFTVGLTNQAPWQLGAFYIVRGAGVAAGIAANIATVLSNFATYMKSQTSTAQAKGLWFPDSNLNCADHPSMVPIETDARSSESPTGVVLTLSGNEKYAHTDVGWQRCPVDRIRERSATYANASLEVFYRDCIVGLGHDWFTPGSDLQVWWLNAGTLELLGSDGVDADNTGVAGWRPSAIPKFSDIAKPSQQSWVGAWDVKFQRLVSDG